MSMDKNEFKFPDETPVDTANTGAEAKPDEEVVIVDDTPEQDRNRVPLGKTAEDIAPDDEVAQYGQQVQDRIKQMKRSYHDERRAKETAERERDEAVKAARFYYEQSQKFGVSAAEARKANNEAALEAAKAAVETAEAEIERAYESGDAKAVAKATRELAQAEAKRARAEAIQLAPTPLQPEKQRVQTALPAQTPQVDPKAQRWQEANTWFGSDEEMTSLALGLHQKLVKQGVDPRSDEYYEKVDKRMREVFPDQFEEVGSPPPTDEAKPRPPATVVAPPTRSSAPKKITISKSQEAIAKKLGVPVQEYARQVQLLEQRKNG